jgi:hypothetical protein
MKSWSYGINSYHKTSSICLEEGAWWLFLIRAFGDFICEYTPCIPLPNIKFRLSDKGDIKFNGGNKWTTLKEWYGSLNDIVHLFIHEPILDFFWKKIKETDIEIPYSKLRKLFYEVDKEWWDEQETSAKEMKKDDKMYNTQEMPACINFKE